MNEYDSVHDYTDMEGTGKPFIYPYRVYWIFGDRSYEAVDILLYSLALEDTLGTL
jgi:hypothetical protein